MADRFGSNRGLIRAEENPEAPPTPPKYSFVNEPAWEVTLVSRFAASQPKPFVQAPVDCCKASAVRSRLTYVLVTVSLANGPSSVRSWPELSRERFSPRVVDGELKR